MANVKLQSDPIQINFHFIVSATISLCVAIGLSEMSKLEI